MLFDDIPLVDYEAEVFAECGAWKNFWDLEDSLCLEELLDLYEATMDRQYRLMKVVAASMGADVSGMDDGPSQSTPSKSHRQDTPDWAPKRGSDQDVELPEDFAVQHGLIGYSQK